jgi:glucokinase
MTYPPVVLGLDFGGTKIAAAVCDLAASKLGSVVVDSLAEDGARANFDQGVESARALLASTAPGATLAAVGVSTFGIPFDDRVALAPTINGWESFPLGRELRAAFAGTIIQVANDVKAAALAEARWGSLAGCNPAVYLNLGTGLSAAIVVAGQILAGGHGAAGEIGYNLRTPLDVGVDRGSRLTLEDVVSGQALPRRAAALGLPGIAGGQLTAADVFEASQRDPALDELISAFVTELAFHLTNIAILVDPVRIAVGGGMVRSRDRIMPGLGEALRTAVPFPPELVVADFPDDAPLRGAVAIAIDAASSRTITDLDTAQPGLPQPASALCAEETARRC